jgi:broad specificity phosphatase PhoE
VDAYWHEGDQAAIDGPGAESFIELSKRAKVMLNRLATSTADSILVFSHGEDAGTPEKMRLFRELDTKDPLPNCAGYDLELRDGRWKVLHLVGQDSEVKFIDEFCTDQRMAPIPPGVMIRERCEILNGIRSAKDDFTD